MLNKRVIGFLTAFLQTTFCNVFEKCMETISFFGHIMRNDYRQRDLTEGIVEGKRGRGKPKMQCSNITQSETLKTGEYRGPW